MYPSNTRIFDGFRSRCIIQLLQAEMVLDNFSTPPNILQFAIRAMTIVTPEHIMFNQTRNNEPIACKTLTYEDSLVH